MDDYWKAEMRRNAERQSMLLSLDPEFYGAWLRDGSPGNVIAERLKRLPPIPPPPPLPCEEE